MIRQFQHVHPMRSKRATRCGCAGANRRTCLIWPARELSVSAVPARAWGFLRQRRSRRELSLSNTKAASLRPEQANKLEARGNRYLYEINSRWTIDGTSRKNLGRYVNHSCRPNAETHRIGDKVVMRAIKNIKPRLPTITAVII
jgi:SET domain